MNRFSHLSIIHLTILATLIAFGSGAAVAHAEANSQTRGQELANLQDAYDLMKIADKDYHGHRVRAMKAVDSAAKDINGAAEGKRRGHEAQSTSDEQMQQAATLLESVKSMASSMDQSKLEEHCSKALKEIHTALSLK